MLLLYREKDHGEVFVDAHEFVEVNQAVAVLVELRAKRRVIAGEPVRWIAKEDNERGEGGSETGAVVWSLQRTKETS